MKHYYLNNSGSRWIILGYKVRLIHPSQNYDKIRSVEFFSSFGNFATAHLKYKGKRSSVLLDGEDKDKNPVAFVDYQDKIDY